MKFYFSEWNNLFTHVREAVLAEGHEITTPQDADVLVMYADTRGPLKNLAVRAKSVGKKVYVVQHGRGAVRDYQKPLGAELVADKFLCWGQADYDRMVKLGYGDKTVIVGCPLLKFQRPVVERSEKNVVFIPVNADHEQPENLIVYYELLKMTLKNSQEFLNKNRDDLHVKWDYKQKGGVSFHDISGFTLIAKTVGTHVSKLYHGNVIQSYQGGPDHMKQLFELFSNVDCIVSLDESTTEILAMACDISVVVCDEFKWTLLGGSDYKDIEVINTNAANHCPLSALEACVNFALEHPEDRRAERAQVVQHELGVLLGDPVENILREIGAKRLSLV